MQLNLVFALILSCIFVQTMAGNQCCNSLEKRFLIDEKYDMCEGDEHSNFTGTILFRADQACSMDSIDFGRGPLDDDVLTACTSSGQKVVTKLRTLSRSVLPAGAYFEIQQLAIGMTGLLEGKYILRRIIIKRIDYLKECSSVLGDQAVSSKLAQMLISKKLDLNCLISPSGCWDLFKKGCTTICHGQDYMVQSTANVHPIRT